MKDYIKKYGVRVGIIVASVALIILLTGHRNMPEAIAIMILLNAVGMEWMYKGLEEYTYITIRSVIFKALALVFMFLLIHEKEFAGTGS